MHMHMHMHMHVHVCPSSPCGWGVWVALRASGVASLFATGDRLDTSTVSPKKTGIAAATFHVEIPTTVSTAACVRGGG
jgi:hypothetical protein